MWKKKGGFRKKQFNKRFSIDMIEQKEKSPIICYECKKLGHIKEECIDLEKTKSFLRKRRASWQHGKILISHLQMKIKNADEKEANICLMAGTSSDNEEEIEVTNSNSLDLQEALDKLLSNSSNLSIEYKNFETEIFETFKRL